MSTGKEASEALALVTGASSGIGAAYARELAQRGYALALVARREGHLRALADELSRTCGVSSLVLPTDLAQPEQLARLARWIEEADGLSLLVNAAGFGTQGPFSHSDISSEMAMVQVQTAAPLRLVRAALPGMLNRGAGAIINVSSLGAFAPLPGFSTYAATKAGLLNFTRSLALELEGTGVQVQALCPGFTRTEFQQQEGASLSMVPGFLWMEPEEVVRASLRSLGHGVVCIPGLANRLLAFLAGPLGEPVLRIAARRNGWQSIISAE